MAGLTTHGMSLGTILLLSILALVACDTPPAPGAPGTAPASPTSTASSIEEPAGNPQAATPTQHIEITPSPIHLVEEPTRAVETPRPAWTAIATTTPTSEPTIKPEGSSSVGSPTPQAGFANPFRKILEQAPAPPGWSVRPCDGDGPFLCVLSGGEYLGSVNLSTYPLDTMTDFRKMLVDAGVAPQSFDHKDPTDAAQARQALKAFAEHYHTIIIEDRKATFGNTKTYKRLVTEEINVGELPGLRYGFVLLNRDGSVYERWLSYSAFDGEGLFTMGAAFYPDRELSFRSDKELLQFEPFLTDIVKGLKLPHPDVRGDVSRG